MHKRGICRPLSVVLWLLFVAMSVFGALTVAEHRSSERSSGLLIDEDYNESSRLESFSRLASFVSSVTVCVILMQTRQRVRADRGIPGSQCEDCCASYWCSFCVALQLSTELDWESRHELCSEQGVEP